MSPIQNVYELRNLTTYQCDSAAYLGLEAVCVRKDVNRAYLLWGLHQATVFDSGLRVTKQTFYDPTPTSNLLTTCPDHVHFSRFVAQLQTIICLVQRCL